MPRKTDARHNHLTKPTGDPVLDLLACSMQIALRDADKDGPTAAEARLFITETLSPRALAQLRELRLIRW